MKQSERILLGALLVLLGVFVVVPAVWKVLGQPVVKLGEDVEKAREAVRNEDDQFNLALARIRSMTIYKEQSLSSNASQGELAYQQWLTDLAEIACGFSQAKVDPDRKSAPRNRPYEIVRMTVKGQASSEQVRTFLYRFHRANVLHRMVSLKLDALRNNPSNPRLDVTISAEALSLHDAPVKGATLFPRSVVETIDQEQPGLISLTDTKGFPAKAPFEVRIGAAYHQVVTITDDGWQLEVGQEPELEIAVDDQVEYSPIHPDYVDATEDQFAALIEQNPFAKPAPYRPKLDLIGEKTVVYGATLKLTAKASGFDLKAGDPEFEATSELPDGMSFDDGKLTWTPPDGLAPSTYKVSIRATARGLREPLENEFTLTLRKVNNPPKLEIPDDPVALLGQAMTLQVSGSDEETAAEALGYSLGAGAPDGAAIDEKTGKFTWTPPQDMTPGTVTVAFQVSDDGEPAQTTVVKVDIDVQDDRAVFTYLTGLVTRNSVPEAWLTDRSTDTRVELFEGQQLQYAGLDALVLSIGADFVLLQQNEETLRLKLGSNLKDAEVIARLDPEPTEPEPTNDTDTSDETTGRDSSDE